MAVKKRKTSIDQVMPALDAGTAESITSPEPEVNLDLDETNLSREASLERYSSERRRRNRSFALKTVFGVLIAAMLLGTGVVWAYIRNINSRLHEELPEELQASLVSEEEAPEPGDPFYMLLLGIDKDEDRAQSAEYGEDDSNYRTDTIMLTRIDPKTRKVTLVSIHRDTLVDLGYNGTDKINSAYSIGGSAYITEVVTEFAGVPISHYAEVDMDRFTRIVDTIGGIEVDLPVPVYDPNYTGLNLEAGVQELDGHTAALLCRCRHGYDEYGDGDIFRAANQRMVISAIARKVLQLDPVTMAATISTMAGAVSTDLEVGDIITLANQFRGMDVEEDIMTGMEPTTSMYVNETWYEICEVEEWQHMMQRVNQGLPPFDEINEDRTAGIAGSLTDVDHSSKPTTQSLETQEQEQQEPTEPELEFSGSVQVLNGTGIEGFAARIAASLNARGFWAYTGNASNFSHETTLIIYNGEDHEAQAQAVNEALGGEMLVMANDGSYVTDADVLVILGSDAA